MASLGNIPQGFRQLGGMPQKSPDLVASIIYIVAYALLIPFAVYRLAVRRTRIDTLLRPILVIATRIAAFVVRAIQTNGKATSHGLYTAEQVLLLVGFIPLCEPLLSLTRHQLRRRTIPTQQAPGERKTKSGAEHTLAFFELVLLTALALAGCVGSQAGSTLSDSGQLVSLRIERYAMYGLTLGVIICAPLFASFMTLRCGLPRPPVLFLYGCALLVGITTIYGLCIAIYPISPISSGGKLGFYLLSCLPEFLCTAVYLGIDLEALFEINEGAWKRKVQRKMHKGTWTGPFVSRRSRSHDGADCLQTYLSTSDVSYTGGLYPNGSYGDVEFSSERAEASSYAPSKPSYY